MTIKYRIIASIFISLLIIRFVVFILWPSSVQGDGDTPVINIIAPTLSTFTLSPEGTQPRETQGQLYVTTTGAQDSDNWRVTASDLEAQTAGHMTEYVNGAYNTSTRLANAMQVSGPEGTATLPAAAIVISGNGTVTDQPFLIEFQQTVQWTDPVSSNYGIVVTFTAEFTD